MYGMILYDSLLYDNCLCKILNFLVFIYMITFFIHFFFRYVNTNDYYPNYGCPPASPASRKYLLLDNKIQDPSKRPMSFDDHLLPLPEDDHPLVIDEGRQHPQQQPQHR